MPTSHAHASPIVRCRPFSSTNSACDTRKTITRAAVRAAVSQPAFSASRSTRPFIGDAYNTPSCTRAIHRGFVAFVSVGSYDAAIAQFESISTPARITTMKFPGGLNIQAMMKQAQQMQEKMAREMEEMRVEASAGGGVVNVTMKGDHEIISLKVDPEIVKENDIEMLQDMIVAAINEGNRKVNEAMKSKLGSMLPPGLGNLL